MSPKAAELLTSLRKNIESESQEADGARWGMVYLPNCGTGHSFAGLLSALEADGLYRPVSDLFGNVKMAAR